ncbi:MAG: carotenoid biosynthesis protein [Patescibacteria group bacterium]
MISLSAVFWIHAFEMLGIFAFFILLGRSLWRKQWLNGLELVSASVFGLLLEISNMAIGHTYAYSTDFFFMIAGAPVVIGLGWATIIYSVMQWSDVFAFPWYKKPLLDAFSALILDLAIDAVAIRIGLWSWTIPLSEEWFGVPYENLIGWILVVFLFSFFVRWIRQKKLKPFLHALLLAVLPILSYMGLLVGFTLYTTLSSLPYIFATQQFSLFLQPNTMFEVMTFPEVQTWKGIWLFLVTIGLATQVIIAKKQKIPLKAKQDILTFGVLTGLHLFFLAVLFTTLRTQSPQALFLIGLSSFAVHLWLHIPRRTNQTPLP